MKYEIITLTPSQLVSFEGKIVQVLKTDFLHDYPIRMCCLVERPEKNKHRDIDKEHKIKLEALARDPFKEGEF